MYIIYIHIYICAYIHIIILIIIYHNNIFERFLISDCNEIKKMEAFESCIFKLSIIHRGIYMNFSQIFKKKYIDVLT